MKKGGMKKKCECGCSVIKKHEEGGTISEVCSCCGKVHSTEKFKKGGKYKNLPVSVKTKSKQSGGDIDKPNPSIDKKGGMLSKHALKKNEIKNAKKSVPEGERKNIVNRVSKAKLGTKVGPVDNPAVKGMSKDQQERVGKYNREHPELNGKPNIKAKDVLKLAQKEDSTKKIPQKKKKGGDFKKDYINSKKKVAKAQQGMSVADNYDPYKVTKGVFNLKNYQSEIGTNKYYPTPSG